MAKKVFLHDKKYFCQAKCIFARTVKTPVKTGKKLQHTNTYRNTEIHETGLIIAHQQLITATTIQSQNVKGVNVRFL